MTRLIGLAGRPGCGKSAAARELARRAGVEAVDLDRVAWETYVPGTPTYDRLVARFGRGILAEDGQVDREELSRLALVSATARRDLEAIVHPAVGAWLAELRRAAEERGVEIVIVEGALLASSQHVDRSLFDAILWLEASDGTRRERLRAAGRERHADRMQGVRPAGATAVVDAEGTVAEVAERVARAIGL